MGRQDRSEIPGYFQLQREFKVRVGHVQSYLKTKVEVYSHRLVLLLALVRDTSVCSDKLM